MSRLKKIWWLIPLVLFLLVAININLFINSWGIFDKIEENDKNFFVDLTFKGRILKKTDNPKSQLDKTVIISNNVIVHLGVEHSIFNYVNVGDSIVKKSGELAIDIFSPYNKDTTMMIRLN